MQGERGSFIEAGIDQVRRSVLDAVGSLIADRRWDHLSLAEIAAESGVTLERLSREFGGREGLLEAYVILEAAHVLDEVDAIVSANQDDLEAALYTAFSATLRLGETHPVINAVVTGDISPRVLAPLLTVPGHPVIDLAAGRLTATLASYVPWVELEELEALSDLLVRVAVSYLIQGEPDIDGATERVRHVFGPFVREYLEARRPGSGQSFESGDEGAG